eukprot:7377517-Prymnesium_polylepis.3
MHIASTRPSPVSSRPDAGISSSSTSATLAASSTACIVRAGLSSEKRCRCFSSVTTPSAVDASPSSDAIASDPTAGAPCAKMTRARALVSQPSPAATIVTTRGADAIPLVARCCSSDCSRRCLRCCVA